MAVTATSGWVPIPDAARFFAVSQRTIRRRIDDGTLTAQRFGPRLIRVWLDASDLGREQ